MDFTPFIAPTVSIVVAIVGGYFAVTNAITRTVQALRVDITRIEQQLIDLRADVEKHNQMVERTYRLEQDMKTAFHVIDELKESDKRIEQRIEKLHG